MSPIRARSVCAAMKPSAVWPSSIGASGGPRPRIWKKWSITQIESKPASSAVRADAGQRRTDGGRAARPRELVDLEPELHIRTWCHAPLVRTLLMTSACPANSASDPASNRSRLATPIDGPLDVARGAPSHWSLAGADPVAAAIDAGQWRQAAVAGASTCGAARRREVITQGRPDRRHRSHERDLPSEASCTRDPTGGDVKHRLAPRSLRRPSRTADRCA